MMTAEEYRRLLADKQKPKAKKAINPVDVAVDQTDSILTITISGSMPSLPNSHFHYKVKTKLRTKYEWLLRACRIKPVTGKVRMSIVAYYASKPKDDDNFTASYKIFRDAIVNVGVLPDDSPEYIEQPPHYEQIKCNRKSEVRTIITITKI